MHTNALPSSFDARRNAARRALPFFAALAALLPTGCAEEAPTCAIRDNGDGTQTLACGADEVVFGGGCTTTDDGDGTQTIACPDGTNVTVADGVSCGLTDPGDGTVTFSCSDGTEWTFAPGCESRVFDFRTHEVVVADCPNGSTVPLTFSWKHVVRPQIAAGDGHACGLRADGSAHCWGEDEYGETDAPEDLRFLQITAGDRHSCGLALDGTSHCWGGDGGNHAADDQPGETFVELVAGGLHTCGLRADGTSHCWGNDEVGQSAAQPTERFVQLDTGRYFTCGLRADGSPLCWGDGFFGQRLPPAGEAFVQISAGAYHACGLRADGSALCWGSGTYGQTADQGDERFVQLAAGGIHTCGIRVDGSLHCWGAVGSGALPVEEGETWVQLASSGGNPCGLRADGTVKCWGNNEHGQTDPQWQFGCRAADAPGTLSTGLLAYDRWSFVTTGLPDFDLIGAPDVSGTVTNVYVPGTGDGFAVRITGYVNVPADGYYTFGLTSDAGSRLTIGADAIIDHDGQHTASTKTGFLCLDAGFHELTVEYFEDTGEETLSLTMAPGAAAAEETLAAIDDADFGYVP